MQLAAAALLTAALTLPTPVPLPPSYALQAGSVQPGERVRIEGLLGEGIRRVERFFGVSFSDRFAVEVLPTRSAFNMAQPPEWGLGVTQCWVVATGEARALRLLAPSAWKAEACEHDPEDTSELRRLVAHELVHVFHGQHHPSSPDLSDAEDIGWFVEGLAVLVSGQLDVGRRERAFEALVAHAGPKRLGDAWSGPYRYGVAGTLVEVVLERVDRRQLLPLLAATRSEQLLAAAHLDEAGLLAAWRERVTAAHDRASSPQDARR